MIGEDYAVFGDDAGLGSDSIGDYGGDMDAEQPEMINKVVSGFSTAVSGVAGILGVLLTGRISAGKAAYAFVKKGMKTETAQKIITAVVSGSLTAEQAAGSLTPDDFEPNSIDRTPTDSNNRSLETGSSSKAPEQDPNNYDFWSDFVEQWYGKDTLSMKDMMAEDDAFIKENASGAFGKYNDLLSGLQDQATAGTGHFKPVRFGMGDFQTSFVPRTGLNAARAVSDIGRTQLTNDLALTDIMQPNKAGEGYMNKLQDIAMQIKAMKNSTDISAYANRDRDKDDSGTWLDAIADVMKVGSNVADIWDKFQQG